MNNKYWKKFDSKLLIPDLINYIDRLKERSNFCETRESYDEKDCSADIHQSNFYISKKLKMYINIC